MLLVRQEWHCGGCDDRDAVCAGSLPCDNHDAVMLMMTIVLKGEGGGVDGDHGGSDREAKCRRCSTKIG